MRNRLIRHRVIVSIVIFCLAHGVRARAATPYKVLHVMSYDAGWIWAKEQLQGFQYALQGLPVEYAVIEMQSKQNSSPEWVDAIRAQVREKIAVWQPDLLFTSDDAAQAEVARAYVNTALPIVFSGVNAAPESYGFVGSPNVAGVIEHEHFVASIRLLQAIQPTVKRIAMLTDPNPMWQPVIARMQANQAQLTDVTVVAWDTVTTYRDYQAKILAYQTTVDAIGFLGIFEFRDAYGAHMPYQEVAQWTATHSALPDFSFWSDRITYGTLCAVTVSGYEQGLAAGQIARGILSAGRSPASYPMLPTVKGQPMISLARAQKLGLTIDSELLLNAEIVTTFGWEPKANAPTP
jgi:ABC-type uncharacterized transport system substrate-binding protein